MYFKWTVPIEQILSLNNSLGCGVALIYSFHKSCFNHNEREKLPTYIGKKSTKPHEISNFIYKRKNAHI